jgi:hypothetical protein
MEINITRWVALLSVRVPPGIGRLDHRSTYRQSYRIRSVLSTAAIDVEIESSIRTLTCESLYKCDDKKAVFDPWILRIFVKRLYRKTSSASLTYIPNPDKPVVAKRKSRFIGESNIENWIMNIHSKIFNHMMIAKISPYKFFATKCIKIIHKGLNGCPGPVDLNATPQQHACTIKHDPTIARGNTKYLTDLFRA